MRAGKVVIALVALLVALVLQGALFSDVKPFGVAPEMLLLVTIASARWMDPEPAVFLGFTAGLLADTLSLKPLGLHAMVFTLVAYTVVRLRHRFEYNPLAALGSVYVLTLGALLLTAVISTLFGVNAFEDTDVWKKLFLAPLWNTLLGLAVLPLMARLLRPAQSRSVLA